MPDKPILKIDNETKPFLPITSGGASPYNQPWLGTAAGTYQTNVPRDYYGTNPMDWASYEQFVPAPETDRASSAILRGRVGGEAFPAPVAEEDTGEMTFQDYLDMYGGSFNGQPYDDYMNYLAQQDTDTYNRIQAMYAKLAEDAGANVERIKDIYGGAEQGVGQAYEGAKGTTEAAYASAQQQAADQLARLGIAEAAPAVIDPMALSQAEAVSNLAASEGAGQSAVTQRGATSRDFASQMAQVGQQQGLEATAQILREMGQRQAEAAFQRAQAEASYNPYSQAMARLQAEQAFNAPQAAADQAAQEQAWEAFKFDVQNRMNYDEGFRRFITDMMDPKKGGMTFDEAVQAYQAAPWSYIPAF